MYRLGEQSTAEETLTAWRKGELGTRVLVDHREAKGKVDAESLRDAEYTMAQLVDVYGPAAEWHDMPRKYADMRDPRICRDDAEAARYFLNRGIPSADGWIASMWKRQEQIEVVAAGTAIALGFDGSLNDDSTVLIGARDVDGFLFPVDLGEAARARGPAVKCRGPRSSKLSASVRPVSGDPRVLRPARVAQRHRRAVAELGMSGSSPGRPAAMSRWAPRWIGCTQTSRRARCSSPAMRVSSSTSATRMPGSRRHTVSSARNAKAHHERSTPLSVPHWP